MSGQQPNSLRDNEMPEYPFVGPFGGINSEVSLDKIGRSGFQEIQNVMFRKSQASIFPVFTALTSPSGEIIIGVADFFNQAGVRISVVWTPTKMYTYNTGVWTQITGAISYSITGSVTSGAFVNNEGVIQTGTNATGVMIGIVGGAGPLNIVALCGTPNGSGTWVGEVSGAVFTPTGSPVRSAANLGGTALQFMQWDVVGYRLYFSQQADKVWVWDGITPSFSPATVSSVGVAPKYLIELNFQLLVANVIAGGGASAKSANAMFWSAPGDGTNWTSFAAGSNNLFNSLGPINGLARVYQAGYAFQQWGITQIIPTGNGLAPFQFIPMGSKSKGNILPYGMASFGELIACYVGKNDIYIFDGTQPQPIGSRPIDGNRRLGARARIFSDLFLALQTNIFGFIMSSANGNDYESYWILIPNLNKAWIYHFDEGNWTQQFFTPSRLIGPVGILPLATIPEILQLVGTILSQSWSPSSLSNANQLDTMVISDSLVDSVSYLNFGVASSSPTSGSINSNDGWYIKSGQLEFDDPRHNHAVKKVRISCIDYANVTINFRFTNEFGQISVATLTYGTGSGATIKSVVDINLQGKFITWEMSGPQGINWGMSEITPYYDVGGEVQNTR